MKYHLILLAILNSTLTIPWGAFASQAQVGRSPVCLQVAADDQLNRYNYPTKPIPESIAIDEVQGQIASFAEVAELAAPGKLNADALSRKLFLWLQGNPTALAPEAPYAALLDDLLLDVKTDAERAQVLAVLDKLTVQLASRLAANEPEMGNYAIAIARFYSQLKQSDRAAKLLEQSLQASLKQPDARLRGLEIGRILKAAIDLKQTAKIAPYADRIAEAIEPSVNLLTPRDLRFNAVAPLALAEIYGTNKQPDKGIKLLDRVAKLLPKDTVNPEIPRLYLQLGKFDQAQVYIDRLMKTPFYDDGEKYGTLAATYEKAKRGNPQAVFNRIWSQIQNDLYDNKTPLLTAYFKAGGNPELMFQTLKSAPVDERINGLLTVAGEYNKRGKAPQATQAIDLLVQTFKNNPNSSATYVLFLALRQGYQGEVGAAFQKLARINRIAADSFIVEVAQKTNQLELAEPPIQRLLKTDPDSRIDLLKQLAIAYAQQGKMEKAVAIAERIPRREPMVSTAVDTLTQVATQLHLLGKTTESQAVFSKTEKIIGRIQELPARSIGYGSITREYQRLGRDDDAFSTRNMAIRVAQSVPNQPNKGIAPEYTLARLAQQYADVHQVQAAWQALQAIPEMAYKDTNLSTTLMAAIEVGDLAVAASLATLSDRHQSPDGYLFIADRLVNAYLAQNRPAEATQVAVRAGELLLAQKERSPDTLTRVARLLGQLGKKDLAQQLLANYPFPGNLGYESRRQELKAQLACYQ
jgi:tetratricopeptide (TPR) repeat protein